MMGSSHALSGAAFWVGGSLALDYFADFHQTPMQLAVGTAICAGGALLPDLDLSGRVVTNKGGATVAYDAGRVSPASMADVVTRETGYRAVVREGRGR